MNTCFCGTKFEHRILPHGGKSTRTCSRRCSEYLDKYGTEERARKGMRRDERYDRVYSTFVFGKPCV